jgi:hypothetical protein
MSMQGHTATPVRETPGNTPPARPGMTLATFRLPLCVLLLATFASALSAAPKSRLSTGRVIHPADILQAAPGTLLGDRYYAEVDSTSLPKLYRAFRKELLEHGIVERSDRYTCKHFAALFAEMAQARFYKENVRTESQARALAIGSIWYLRDDGQGPHAIVQVLTERGRVYLEPQTGEELQLSTKEEASAYFRFF